MPGSAIKRSGTSVRARRRRFKSFNSFPALRADCIEYISLPLTDIGHYNSRIIENQVTNLYNMYFLFKEHMHTEGIVCFVENLGDFYCVNALIML